MPLALPPTKPPVMPALRVELLPALLRCLGLVVGLNRVREAVAAGWIAATRQEGDAWNPAGIWSVEQDELDAVERYFREQEAAPPLPAHRRVALARR